MTEPIPFDQAKRKTNGKGRKREASRDRPESEPSDAEGGLSQRDKLLIAARGAELWCDHDHVAYATIRPHGHAESYPIRSSDFRRYLIRAYLEMWSTVVDGERRPAAPSATALAETIAALDAQAAAAAQHEPALRVGRHEDRLYLDLGREAWEAVEITSEAWRVVDAAPVRFVRPRGLRPLPVPEHGGSIDELRDLVHFPLGDEGDTAFRLLVGWLIGTFLPAGPYAPMFISGEQGSGKSTLCAVAKRLLDPGLAERRAAPKDERDLVIAALHSRVLYLDNLSEVPGELADALARLSTGLAYGGRALFTDAEESAYSVIRPAIVNGIPDLASRADLADRAICLKLAAMPEGQRRSEREFWADFDLAAPRILGALLDGVVAALASRDEIEELIRDQERPRMLDFAVWAEAASGAFGWPRWAWLHAYNANRGEVAQLAIEADPVASAIRDLINQQGAFEGSMTALLSRLEEIAGERVKRSRSWPRDATRLSGRVRRALPGLRRCQIEVVEDRSPDRDRKRLVRIQRLHGR